MKTVEELRQIASDMTSDTNNVNKYLSESPRIANFLIGYDYASSLSMESQWISVEERFPEAYSELGFSVNVLLYTGGKTPKIGYYDLKQNKFFDDDIRIYAVSHWQPLPENPPTK